MVEIGDVCGELNNLMLSHLRLGVVIMKFCKDSLCIILKFLGELLSSFRLEGYQNRVHEGLLLTRKQFSRGVTVFGMKFGVKNVPKALCPCSSVEGVMEGVIALLNVG